MRILVTGGAGFIGGHLALALRREIAGARVVAFDNLRRRGSELNLPRLRAGGVEMVHGDVRSAADLEAAGGFDLLVECSADPSVVAWDDAHRAFALETNVTGAIRCAEACRRHGAALIFLSTSRVHPLGALRAIALRAGETRFELADRQELPGVSAHGISEELLRAGASHGARTFYGAGKLAAELVLEEYREALGLPVVVDRCGVIAGPWQFGRVDQGVLVWWVLSHLRGEPLRYLGYGGLQVRDVLHVDDLCRLVVEQARAPERHSGPALHVGGGASRARSLRELTALCREITGERVEVTSSEEERYGDVPWFVTDHRRLSARCGWEPRIGVEETVEEVCRWLRCAPELVQAW